MFNRKLVKIKTQTANFSWRSARMKFLVLGHTSYFLLRKVCSKNSFLEKNIALAAVLDEDFWYY